MSETTIDKVASAEEERATLPPRTSFRAENPPAPRRRLPWRGLLGLAVLAVLGVWGVRLFLHHLSHAETDDAFLTSNVHMVNAHVAGTIAEVLVEPNTEVKAGDVLFRLDPRDHESKLRQAEAQLAQSEAMTQFTKAQIVESKAKVDMAHAQEVKAGSDFKRSQELARTKVVSSQELDSARAAVDSARASLASAQAALLGMESGLTVAEASRENSRVAVENARLQLSYNTITAPVGGRTSRRSVEQGAYVQPGQALIGIVEPRIWIEANFKETQLAKMRVGQPVGIAIDAIPGQHFTGRIESFSPASGSTFAMLPPDNATGNFTKVVQRLPVRVRFDDDSVKGFEERLRAGLSAVVEVDLAHGESGPQGGSADPTHH